MSASSHGLALLLTTLSAAAPQLAAQRGSPPPDLAFDPVGPAASAVGLNELDGALVGGGPSYSVRIEPGAFWFTPLFGRSVPVDQPVGFELLSIERGGELVHAPSAPAAPRQDGGAARFEHGGGITERYELRAEGVEQSFVFAEALPGSGDLVVRGRLTSPLVFPADGDHSGGLSLDLPGVGSVRWGGVTGIDAAGRRAAGSLWLSGRVLELRLPAAFVDGASYPLVLDPLVAGGFSTADPLGAVTDPDVAYDQSFGRYLVVWTVFQSAANTLVRAQRVSSTGVFVGGMLTLAATLQNERARVANINLHDRFLVVWKAPFLFGGDVLTGIAVPASTALAISPTALLAAGADIDSHSLGGEWTSTTFQEALLVFEDASDIHGVLVDVPAAGAPVGGTNTTLLSSDLFFAYSLPAVSRTNGANGAWLLAYRSGTFLITSSYHVRGVPVDRSGALIGTTVAISDSVVSSAELTDIHTDGNGQRFVTAWEQGTGVKARAQRILAGQLVQEHPAQTVFGDELLGLAFGQFKAYAATFSAEGLCVVFDVFDTTGYLDLIGIDPATCLTCESIDSVEAGCGASYDVALASTLSGGDTSSDRGLIAGRETSLDLVDEELFGVLFEQLGAGGASVNLGGQCGLGGTIGTFGPIALGNSSFTLTLSGADAISPLAFLNIASNAVVPLTCGPCTWNPFALVWTRVPVAGMVSLPVPIPCEAVLLGVSVQAQWTLVSPGSSACASFPGVAVSDRLRLTLGL